MLTTHAAMPTFKWRYCETCKVLRRDVEGRTMDCGHTNRQPEPTTGKTEDQSLLDVLVSWQRYN